jgi:dGTPase
MDLQLWQEAFQALGIQEGDFTEMARRQAIRYLINLEVTDVITTINNRLQELEISSAESVRNAPVHLVGFSAGMQSRNRQLKGFLLDRLYRHYRVMRMQVKAQRLIRRLFRAYLDEPRQLPMEIQARLGQEAPERVICDYIAGMTDRFSIQEHHKLFDPATRG